MRKVTKITSLLLAIMMVAMFTTNVFAVTNPSSLTGTPTTEFDDLGNKIIGIIQAVGSIVSVVVLVVIGIKYMMGSAQEKAEYKKTMIPYIIGAIIVFAASNIAGVVFNMSQQI